MASCSQLPALPYLQKKDSQGRQAACAHSNLEHPLEQRLCLKWGSLEAAGQTLWAPGTTYVRLMHQASHTTLHQARL